MQPKTTMVYKYIRLIAADLILTFIYVSQLHYFRKLILYNIYIKYNVVLIITEQDNEKNAHAQRKQH